MAESQHPKIELDYRLTGDSIDSSVAFALAGKKYGETRSDDEEVDVLIQPRAQHTSVKYARRVIQNLSYAEISHKADEMQAQIESRIAQFGAGSIAVNSFVGSRLSGNLPEQE